MKGPNVMQGYLNKPEDTAQTLKDGWLHTGDVASLDLSGHIRIIDRKKDMLIVDGLNVYPYEVEEALYRHDAIKDCSMIGVPHGREEGKELGIMYVVLKEGAQATPKELRDYLAACGALQDTAPVYFYRGTAEDRDGKDHEKRTEKNIPGKRSGSSTRIMCISQNLCSNLDCMHFYRSHLFYPFLTFYPSYSSVLPIDNEFRKD